MSSTTATAQTRDTSLWTTILVPIDFSPCSARALAVAAAIAKVHRAELVLLHVSELPPNLSADTDITPAPDGTAIRAADYAIRGALRQLELLAEPLERDGIAVSSRAITGDVVTVILAVAAAIGADVLVVGTHGRSGLSHLLFGSVAEKLLRGATIPVVSIRTAAPETEPTEEERAVEDELAG